MRRYLLTLALGAASLLSQGCTAAGTFLGYSPAAGLSEDAERVRHDRPVEAPRELSKAVLENYTLEPGDGLIVLPVDPESTVRVPGDQTVLPDGTLDLGQYGRLAVVGKTTAEVEAMVNDAVKAKEPKDAKVSFLDVRLVNRVSKVFYVVGEVNSPGSFPFTGRELVLDAILAAGGLTTNASKRNIILVRPSHPCDPRTVLKVCYKDITQLGDTATNYQLMPGDRVYVPSQSLSDLFCRDREPCNCHYQKPLPPVRCAAPAGCATGTCATDPVAVPK